MGLGAAIARGVSTGVALAEFAFGAGFLTFFFVATKGRDAPWRKRVEPEPAPPGASAVPVWEAAAAAMLPSTVAVAALVAAALAFNASLAALTAGVLAGLGLAAAVSLVDVLSWERSRSARLLAERGTKRLYFQ